MATEGIPPAAFRRLCVETLIGNSGEFVKIPPAAFRRLCVETTEDLPKLTQIFTPAAFRRLCVETLDTPCFSAAAFPSRLQAAVC